MVAPCGDEENPALLDQYGIDTLFPSPRGDKENQGRGRRCATCCGGFRPLAGIKKIICPYHPRLRDGRFRPLAGIKKIEMCEYVEGYDYVFPSPRGDKENLGGLCYQTNDPALFPSPRGDKENRKVKSATVEDVMFPSPRGDKENPEVLLQEDELKEKFPSPRGDKENHRRGDRARVAVCCRPLAGIKKISATASMCAAISGFRPLAGIKKIRTQRHEPRGGAVSVPSRG